MAASPTWYPRYKLIQWSASLVLLMLLLYGFLPGKFESLHVQLTFCAFGVVTGAAFARMSHPADHALTWIGKISLGFVAASQVFYQMLVWSYEWRVNPSVISWRLWWCTVVIAVGLGWLQVLWRAGARWEGKSDRTTLACTGGLGLLVVGLAFRSNPLTAIPEWWYWVAVLPAMGAIGGSLFIIGQWRRNRPKQSRPLPRWMSPALITGGLLALSAGSFYIGRVTILESQLEAPSIALASMDVDTLQAQVDKDIHTLEILAIGMDNLRDEAETLHGKIADSMQVENRDNYTPTESREIRRLFIEYLSHRDRLIRMAKFYSGYVFVKKESLRHRTFLLGYCAAAVALEAGRKFVKDYRDNQTARDKLNEGIGWLGSGMFDEVYYSVTSRPHLKNFKESGHRYDEGKLIGRWDNLFTQVEIDWLDERIRRGRHAVDRISLNTTRAWFSRIGRTLQAEAYQPVYKAQELAATLVGDTRIVHRDPFISKELVRKTLKQHQLEPGDIILERRNWYLSNAFLPGFWPHTALYVGTPKQLMGIGLNADDFEVAWDAYTGPDQNNEARVILEAVSEGVVFSTAEHSLSADYVAVLRPRHLSNEQRAEVIRRAFKYFKSDYDFNFDFDTDDKLVCSELIYKIYGAEYQKKAMLNFELETVLGKKVLTPLGIMQKFVNERGTPKDQLELIFFLDTPSGAKQAMLMNDDGKACCESVNRPKAFNE